MTENRHQVVHDKKVRVMYRVSNLLQKNTSYAWVRREAHTSVYVDVLIWVWTAP
mgnify:FL=1